MIEKITSKDIAIKAGVSQATVSYILNDKKGKNISKETRDKVLRIAKELNYIPNTAAQRLKKKDTKCIAIRLATNLTTRRYYLNLQGIRAFLEPRGYSLLLCGINEEQGLYPPYITACLSTQADGIIYISSDNTDIPADELETIEKNNIPISVIDCMSDIGNINSISYDYFASSYARAEMLLKRGYKKFIYIRPSYDNKKEDLREKGVKAALLPEDGTELIIKRASGWDRNLSLFSMKDTQEEDRITLQMNIEAKELVYSYPNDTAFICSSLEIEEKIARYIYEKWLLNPKSFTKKWYEPVLSYHFDHFGIGYESARLLLDSIEGKLSVSKLIQQPIIDTFNEDSF